ncbi:AAA family ATPase [Desulfotalea psychrophila]|uniref:Probable transcriptional regulator (MoxR) n=1 Tax=Desulfotalea psychrophila (strain LSv54 / DSM 12343) TaxID=177439 RepID=Q6AQK9_DESPS|nr:MoxR family ATPase [Desulfotalea psychrophila]CAG35364.1 probable transcriptional regulator (MoxR) [Desulfotalea psychrophila LSv54]
MFGKKITPTAPPGRTKGQVPQQQMGTEDVYQKVQKISQEVENASRWVDPLQKEIAKVIIGQEHLIRSLIIGLLTGGHILLEGLPGLAKTLAVKTLAKAIQVDFRRIQFTPDMLPADIIGTEIYNPQQTSFETKQGPIFSSLILTDEINRAPAKVQSALLEAMEEGQVTIGDTTFPLPELFLVLATQNPVDQEGTYPLPEAQIDRFMLKIVVDYPSFEEELQLINSLEDTPTPLIPIITSDDIFSARRVLGQIYMDEKIKRYIVSLVYATREPRNFGLDLHNYIEIGASPRATINLATVAKALAFLGHRGYVTPDDVKEAAMDVMRHRLRISYEAEAEGISSEDIIRKILDTIPVP